MTFLGVIGILGQILLAAMGAIVILSAIVILGAVAYQILT